jgi:tetratricopeptide (TPR) repeat protein
MASSNSETDPLSQKALRRAFKDWGSLKALGSHPLSSLEIVKARHQLAGYTQTPAGRGLALREVLQAALEALKPTDGLPEPQQKDWRPYIILDEQYCHGRSPEWVAAQFHVSKGTYYTEQQRALESLADILRTWEEQQHRQQTVTPEQPGRLPAGGLVPFLAPPRPAHQLMGRADLLQELKGRLMSGSDTALTALNGLPGVGKTTLAIELAHDPEILSHFEDGVLWVGLGRQPDVLALLGNWAAAVGVLAEIIAQRGTVAERAAAIHAAISLRRMLLIIDDAWQIDAALAFKVGGPNCAHLVTTRLANVALDFAGDGVTVVRELDLSQGFSLLEQLAPRAVALEPAEARKLVQSVGGLPLALILMGGYLRKQSYSAQPRRLREALRQLQAVETRLQLTHPQAPLEAQPTLSVNTPLSLQATIGFNDAALDECAHRALLDLSLFAPKPNSFSEAAALVVMAAPAAVIDTLVDHGLVECLAPDRYTLHQTIADYAGLQGAGPAAAERLVSYFVQYVETNTDRHSGLEPELTNILVALEMAFTRNMPDLLIRGVNALHPFLETRGLYQTDEWQLRRTYVVAQAVNDQVGLALTLYSLGDLHVKLGQFKEAQIYFEQSIALARSAQARRLEAKALFDLGLACWYLAGKAEDKNYFERAWHLYREVGDRSGEGYALNGLGFACVELCDFDQARAYLEQAIHVCRASGNRRGEGWAHYNLGTVYLPLGDFDQAADQMSQCLKIYRELGDRRGEGWLIYNQGRLYRQLGRYDAARIAFEQARQTFDDLGDRFGLGWAVHNLSLVQAEAGDEVAALTQFQQALRYFQQIGCRTGEHQTYHSLGVMFRRRGDYTQAQTLLERALEFRRQIGYLRGVSKSLAHLGLVYSCLGDARRAVAACAEAERLARQIQTRPDLAFSLTCQGTVLSGLNRPNEAVASFQQAIAIRRELGQTHLLPDALAGLAAAALAQGYIPPARQAVTEIMGYLDANDKLFGVDQPGQVYLTCYRVLQTCGERQAPSILDRAYRFLQDRAAKIDDGAQRHLFWDNVPAHQEIRRLGD